MSLRKTRNYENLEKTLETMFGKSSCQYFRIFVTAESWMCAPPVYPDVDLFNLNPRNGLSATTENRPHKTEQD